MVYKHKPNYPTTKEMAKKLLYVHKEHYEAI